MQTPSEGGGGEAGWVQVQLGRAFPGPVFPTGTSTGPRDPGRRPGRWPPRPREPQHSRRGSRKLLDFPVAGPKARNRNPGAAAWAKGTEPQLHAVDPTLSGLPTPAVPRRTWGAPCEARFPPRSNPGLAPQFRGCNPGKLRLKCTSRGLARERGAPPPALCRMEQGGEVQSRGAR